MEKKKRQAEYKYFVSPPDSFFVWSSDLTDLPLKMKREMQDCTFSAKLSWGYTWLPFPNHIRKGLCVFLQPLFALTPGRQSGAAWHGEPGPRPLAPGPRRSSGGTLFPPRRQGWSREHPVVFILGVIGCGCVCPCRFSPGSRSRSLIVMQVPGMRPQSQWASGNPREQQQFL